MCNFWDIQKISLFLTTARHMVIGVVFVQWLSLSSTWKRLHGEALLRLEDTFQWQMHERSAIIVHFPLQDGEIRFDRCCVRKDDH